MKRTVERGAFEAPTGDSFKRHTDLPWAPARLGGLVKARGLCQNFVFENACSSVNSEIQ